MRGRLAWAFEGRARVWESAMKEFLLQIFTWWNRETMGTRFLTWRKGERVGEDENGNIYFRTRGGAIDPALGVTRRWVIYRGVTDPTTVPPGWYGWLHHQTDLPPTEQPISPREWERPREPNRTGTPYAYRPRGSTLASGGRPRATGDYQAWTPGG